MKWFKHDSNSIHEAPMEKLIQKYGIEGYGLFYACIELISQRLSSENVDFELHHDAETLAIKFKIDTLRVEEIMKFCIKENLFNLCQETNKIYCLRLVKMMDISTSNNPEIKKILSNKNYQKLLDVNNTLHYITLDNITLHKKDNPASGDTKAGKTRKLTDEQITHRNAIIDLIKNKYKENTKNGDEYHIDGREGRAIKDLIKFPMKDIERKLKELVYRCKDKPEYFWISASCLMSNWNKLSEVKDRYDN